VLKTAFSFTWEDVVEDVVEIFGVHLKVSERGVGGFDGA
jgi:hypothetical protein